MPRPKPPVDKDLQAAVDLGNTTEAPYEEVQYETTVRENYVETDPILAAGDPHAIVPEEVQEAMEENVEEVGEDVPLVELDASADPIARLAAAMEKIASGQRPIGSMDNKLMEKLVNVLEKVASGQSASTKAAAEAIRQGKDPSNFFHPDVSCFNPRGERDYPRPHLKCKMHLPWEAERESMTREEIELLNLLEPGEFFITRTDESRIMVRVTGRINGNTGKHEVLFMNSETAFNDEYAYLMPPLRRMLRDILSQRPNTRKAANDVRTMEDELALIEQYGIHFDKQVEVANG